MTKTCSHCRNDFDTDHKNESYCRSCRTAYQREYRAGKRSGPTHQERQSQFNLGLHWCSRCTEWLPVADFTRRSGTRFGLTAYCRRCNAVYTQEHKNKNYSHYRGRRHGLTGEQYELMVQQQDNRCAICGREGELFIDHDHSCCAGNKGCGKCVRGLLCASCNKMVGFSGESVEVLAKAAAYLMATQVQETNTREMAS